MQIPGKLIQNFLPANYGRAGLLADIVAGLVVAAVLIPQGMAYAVLAGLPVEAGLYAGVFAPIAYALVGSSRTLSVGPVSVTALLVTQTLAATGSTDYFSSALLLTLLSAAFYGLLALLRAEVLVRFIGHPVMLGFSAAVAVLIIFSQVSVMAGGSDGRLGPDLLAGALALLALFFMKYLWPSVGPCTGLPKGARRWIEKLAPLVILIVFTYSAFALGLAEKGLAVVGPISDGLPKWSWHFIAPDQVLALLPGAALISVIGYVESIAIAKDLATRNRQKLNPRQELFALGAANTVAAFSSGMPVAGSYGRSYLNHLSGAESQVATLVASLLVALVLMLLTDWLFYLPKSVLAALIVISVLPLIRWKDLRDLFRYDPAEAGAFVVAFAGVLIVGVEVGLLAGVLFTLMTFVWRSSRPHVAVVGLREEGGFRNVKRYTVKTWPELLLIRVDRSLYFANADYVDTIIRNEIARAPELKHIVLIGSGVNDVDSTAVDWLVGMHQSLREAGVTLNFAELKGPVEEKLLRAPMHKEIFEGRTFTTTHDAVTFLTGERYD